MRLHDRKDSSRHFTSVQVPKKLSAGSPVHTGELQGFLACLQAVSRTDGRGGDE